MTSFTSFNNVQLIPIDLQPPQQNIPFHAFETLYLDSNKVLAVLYRTYQLDETLVVIYKIDQETLSFSTVIELVIKENVTAAVALSVADDKFAVGCANGKLVIIDYKSRSPYVSQSVSDAYTHKEQITSLKQVRSRGKHLLISVSVDGKLLVWSQEDVEYPVAGYHLKFKSKDYKSVLLAYATAVELLKSQPLTVIVGTNGCLLNRGKPL